LLFIVSSGSPFAFFVFPSASVLISRPFRECKSRNLFLICKNYFKIIFGSLFSGLPSASAFRLTSISTPAFQSFASANSLHLIPLASAIAFLLKADAKVTTFLTSAKFILMFLETIKSHLIFPPFSIFNTTPPRENRTQNYALARNYASLDPLFAKTLPLTPCG
jgi:hypothetical protein